MINITEPDIPPIKEIIIVILGTNIATIKVKVINTTVTTTWSHKGDCSYTLNTSFSIEYRQVIKFIAILIVNEIEIKTLANTIAQSF